LASLDATPIELEPVALNSWMWTPIPASRKGDQPASPPASSPLSARA
jgi:hypothetical protein